MNPKNVFKFLSFLFVLFLFACDDGPSGPNLVTEPEALPENDTSGKGIYKGIVVGSTGFFVVNIDNNGSGNISATLVIDGQTHQLQTTQTYNEAGFQGYFRKETTGGLIQVGYWVNADGNDYGTFEVSIPGHEEVEIVLFKEKSTDLVKCYEGSLSGSTRGAINFVVRGDEVRGLIRFGSAEIPEFEGDIVSNELTGQGDVDGDGIGDIIEGVISGNSASGTITVGELQLSWQAERTR